MELRNATVEIIGLGQIGSSLAAALVKRRLVREVIGVTRRPAVAREALRRKIVHRALVNPSPLVVPEANIVIFATPVRTILQQIRRIPFHLRPVLFMDVGSTKREIIEAALTKLPKINFIGGHPMTGNEKAGIDACNPALFVDRPFILIEAQVLDREVAAWAKALVRGIGARLITMRDGQEHDFAMAVVSHLPYMFAYTLTHLADELSRRRFAKKYGADFLLKLAGPSFRDATRVASSQPDMVFDFLWTNRQNVCEMLDALGTKCGALKMLLERANEKNFRSWLEQGRRTLRRF